MSSPERKRISTADPDAWDAFIAAEIRRFVRDFQGIEILVTPHGAAEAVSVPVHAPYMQQSVSLIEDGERFDRLAPRHQERLRRVETARDEAPAEVRAFLDGQLYGAGRRERMLAQGRAERDEIQRLLQDAVDQGLVPAGGGRSYPDGHDLRQWLVTYGIGVDCSAFVQQVLTRLMQVCHAADGESSGQRQGPGVGWITSLGVYAEVTAGPRRGSRFDRVSTPAQARPGDVLVKQGHIRILASAQMAQGDGLILHLAESTSATDIPSGQVTEEPDIGPRLIQVTYPEPHFPIHAQMALRKRLADGEYHTEPEERRYILGRLRALDRLCRQHRAPEAPAA